MSSVKRKGKQQKKMEDRTRRILRALEKSGDTGLRLKQDLLPKLQRVEPELNAQALYRTVQMIERNLTAAWARSDGSIRVLVHESSRELGGKARYWKLASHERQPMARIQRASKDARARVKTQVRYIRDSLAQFPELASRVPYIERDLRRVEEDLADVNTEFERVAV